MMCRKVLRAAILLVAAASGPVQASEAGAADVVGRIKTLAGSAVVVTGNTETAAAVGGPIRLNDRIVTGPDGAAGITFVDATRVSVGPDTDFLIDEYVYDPTGGELSFVSSVSQGTLQFVSGGIATLRPDAVSVNTPSGTIGIRGTRFLLRVAGE